VVIVTVHVVLPGVRESSQAHEIALTGRPDSDVSDGRKRVGRVTKFTRTAEQLMTMTMTCRGERCRRQNEASLRVVDST